MIGGYGQMIMGLTLLGSCSLALLLVRLRLADPAARPLAFFLILVGAWSASFLGTEDRLIWCAYLAPLTAAAFVHFVWRLGPVPVVPISEQYRLWGLYGLSVGGIAISGMIGGVEALVYPPFGLVIHYQSGGYIAVLLTLILAVYGHMRLIGYWRQSQGKQRLQMRFLLMGSLFGLISSFGLAAPVIGVMEMVWLLCAMPGYVIILGYGLLRYQMMSINQWAYRGVISALILIFAAVGATGVMAVSLPFWQDGLVFWQIWGLSILYMIGLIWFWKKSRIYAYKLIYPGAYISPKDRADWQTALNQTRTERDLCDLAVNLLSQRLKLSVHIRVVHITGSEIGLCVIGQGQILSDQTDLAAISKTISVTDWQYDISDWQAAPPGIQQMIRIFAEDCVQALRDLQVRRVLADQAAQLATQKHLAELGQLSTVIAHDLRNPLNIISMAAALSPPETRHEISLQLKRVTHLIDDLLDYGKAWDVNWQIWPLEALVTEISAIVGQADMICEIAPDLQLRADREQCRRILVNLLQNARHAQNQDISAGKIALYAKKMGDICQIDICDDGPGVPAEIRDHMFEPFVSRSASGTGLGLAIVARLMAAHGGEVRYIEHPDWSCCFRLIFPGQRGGRQ